MHATVQKAAAPLLLVLLVGIVTASAQSTVATPAAPSYKESPAEFQFVRLAYAANQYSRGWGGRQVWQTGNPQVWL